MTPMNKYKIFDRNKYYKFFIWNSNTEGKYMQNATMTDVNDN